MRVKYYVETIKLKARQGEIPGFGEPAVKKKKTRKQGQRGEEGQKTVCSRKATHNKKCLEKD